MNLHEAGLLVIELMNKYNLFNWNFEFNNRKHTAGLCNYSRKTIYLSRFVTTQVSYKQVKNTILHEIAHALVGSGNNHNKIWKNKAIEIGCNGNRCYDGNTIHVEYKYVGECPTCNRKFHRHRKPKDVSCFKCNYVFNPHNLIIWNESKKINQTKTLEPVLSYLF